MLSFFSSSGISQFPSRYLDHVKGQTNVFFYLDLTVKESCASGRACVRACVRVCVCV